MLSGLPLSGSTQPDEDEDEDEEDEDDEDEDDEDEDDEDVLEMYLQMVSTPAAFPLVLVVDVPLDVVEPMRPAIAVEVVYETAVVIVAVTFFVVAPLTVWTGSSRYWNTPQYTVLDVGARLP